MNRFIVRMSFAALVLAAATPLFAQSETLERWIVPVVGSTAGANGAQFRTSMQLHNSSDQPATGTILYHPAGIEGTPSDPQLRYALAPHETVSFDDIVATLGQSGLGSLDIIADAETLLPTATVRAFNLLPTLGTLGSSVPVLHPDDALGRGDTVGVISPMDQRYRLNIGIRTLEGPVTVRITIFGADGGSRGESFERTFPGEYFEQFAASVLLGTPLQPNESVTIEVLSGRAFIYGSNTDNRTNDPNIQIDRLFGRSISADDQTVTTPEDTPVTITLSGELQGSITPVFSITRAPLHGMLGTFLAGSDTTQLVYTPDANYNGGDDFEFEISDGRNRSARGTVTINVTPVNDPPVATAVVVTTDEDQSVVITLTGSDPDGDALTFAIASAPTSGTLDSIVSVDGTTATIVYTPNPNYNGNDGFTFTVSDGIATSDTATVTIDVLPVNDAPLSAGDLFNAFEDTPLTIAPAGVLANDTDGDGDTLTAVLVTPPATGTLTLNADGSFTYTPAANANGTVSFTYHATDGTDASPDVVVTINLAPVNDAPSFVKGADVSVLEDAGAQSLAGWATALSAGPADESAQTLAFAVTNNSNPTLFSTAPAIAADGTLSFTPAPNANGTATITLQIADNGGTANGGIDTSAPQTFVITVTAVNDAPSFTKGGDATVLEDSGAQTIDPWATALSAGPADETTQTLAFSVTGNTNPALFAAGPSISPTGALTFTPAADASGTATITLQIADNGGTTNGGVDTSATQTFVINVTEVNDAPSFTKGADATVLEDAGAQTLNPWATTISAGPAAEAGQTVAFNVAGNTNPALFAAGPAVSSTGVLTFTPAADAFGSATITIALQDDGGTANGGIDTSATQSFVINVTPVNDAPSATVTPLHAVNEDSGPHNVANYVTAISPGPANESGQTVSFSITGNTNPGLFASGPTIDPAGTLSYTLAANQFGTAVITVQLMDDGGTANGGVDTATLNFTIDVAAVNDAPFVAAGGPFTLAENSANGTSFGATIAATDVDPGQTLSFTITAGNTGGAFAINAATGEITVANQASLDYETSPSFTLTIAATDDGVPPLSGTGTFAIALTDVNETPTVAPATFNVDENAAVATTVGTPVASDPDAGQTLTYAIIAGNTGGAFAINPVTGAITVATPAALDFETTPLFSLSVQVTDNGPGALSATATITVQVNNINEAPVVTGGTFSIAENSAITTPVGSATAIDADAGQTLTYAITTGNTGGAFAIDASTGAITVANSAAVDFETNPTFSLTVTVTDNGVPVLSGNATVTVNLTDQNETPSVDPATFAIDENSANGTAIGTVAASDPDGDALTFSITAGNTGGAFAIDGVTGAITVANVAALDFETNPTFALTVQVQDPGLLTATATVVVNLNDINEAPVFTSAAAASVPENTTAVLTVTTTDPEGQTITYSISGGADAALFTINSTTGVLTFIAAPDFEAPADSDANNVYDVQVQATDGTSPVTQNISVTVTNTNEAPVITSSLTPSVPENTTAVQTVTTTDAEGDTIAYSITGGADAALFSINATTGALTFNAAPDFDIPGDADANNQYVVEVTATDGTTPVAATIAITVTDVNENPVIAPQSFGVADDAPNTTFVGNVVASDPDVPAQTLTYVITAGNTGSAFTIDASTGAITVLTSAAVNFEVTSTFSLTVEVTDNGTGNLSASNTITINVSDVNETPVVNDQTFSVAENSPNTTSVGTVVATDADTGQTLTYAITAGNSGGAFAINAATGEITVANSAVLDFETSPSYSLTVQVTDNGAPVLSDTAIITVNLSDVNEAPVFTSPATLTVPENTTAVLTVTTTDAEGDTITYSITGGADQALFTINGSTGALSFLAAPNFEAPADAGANNVYDVVVTAADGANSPTQAIAVTVTDTNEAPAFTSSATPSVPENTTAVITVTTTDAEGDTIAYSISGGGDAALFSINGVTGALSFLSAPNFEAPTDAGANNVYDVIVTAGDGTNNPTQSIAVTVTNVDEAPLFTSPATPSVPENTTAVVTVTATDPEGVAITYSITGGADMALFTINGTTGALSFLSAPNFEAPTDAGANNIYDVIVTAGDGTNNPTQAIAIMVTNANEAPAITSSATPSVPENTTAVITVTSTDPESDTIAYSISGGVDAAFFTINSSTGALTFNAAPDFESPADAGNNNVYNVQVQATDGTTPVTQNVAVTVTNVNEPPTFTSTATPSVVENTTPVVTVTTTDPEGNTITYSISGGADMALFTINPSTGALSFVAAPNFEAPGDAGANNMYDVIVTAGDGTNNPTQAIVVTVTNANEAPVFTSGTTPSVPENTTAVGTVTTTDPEGNTITYSITGGADAAFFAINSSSGALSFLVAPNFEAPADAGANNVYDVQVQATDGTNPTTQNIAVTVTNVNEAPVITSAPTASVPENSTAVLTVTTTDPEGNTITYSITGGADAGDFSINSSSGALTFNVAPDFEAPADADTNNVYLVQVTATDGTTPVNQTITVTVTNVNEAPTFTSSATPSVPENTTAVITVTTTDPEGNTITYSITGGADAGDFSINSSTGALTFSVAPNFEAPADADINNVYLVQVTATDGTTPITQSLTVTVTNVNETPSITGGTGALNVNENTVGTITTVTATDPDGTAPTFAIVGGADALDFSINATTGALTFVANPNFEAPADADTNNIYLVTVRATDGSLFDDDAITVTVINVNEAPIAGTDNLNYVGNTELRIAGHAGTANAIAFTASATNPLANDSDPDSIASGFGTITVVAVAAGTSAQGGEYRIEADGTMYYTPMAGFTGADSITYQLTDGTNTVNGTINLTMTPTDVVWYVKNNDPTADSVATKDGTSSYPFNTLAAASAASGVNHIIYVHSGDGATTGQNSGIVLKNGQKLWGQGIALVVNGGTTLIVAGAPPQIGNSGGVGVSATNLSGIQIQGLNIGGSTDAIFVTTTGANSGGAEIANNTIRAAGSQGINVDGAGSGTLTMSIHDNTITSTGNAIDVNRTAGTLYITAFDDNTISGNSGASGIVIANAIFDGTAGAPFSTVLGGITSVGTSGNGVGTSGVVLSNVSGDLSFTNLNIFADSGTGLQITGTGAIAASTGTRVTVAAGVGTVDATGGPAVDVNNATVDLQLSSVRSTNTTTRGVSLVSAADGLTNARFSASAGSITSTAGATGPLFNVSGGNIGVSYAGPITNTGTGRAVLVDSWSGDDVTDDMTFSGFIDENAAGILLNNNGGVRSITFSGGIDVDTVAGEGFGATSNSITGGLHITGTTNDITSISATALRVTNTTIGSSNLNFRNISSGNGTAAADPASGIILASTGVTGRLIVAGNGGVCSSLATCTGGAIQNTTSHGISLNSTLHPSFTRMAIVNTAGSGIDGAGVSSFTLQDSFIDNSGTGGGADESNVAFDVQSAGTETNVSGTVTITNNTLTNARWHGVRILNFNGTIADAIITGNTITSSTAIASSLGSGIHLQTLGSAATASHLTKASIANNVISNFPSGAGISVQGGNSSASGPGGTIGTPGSGTNIISITGNVIAGQNAANRMGTSAILATVSGGNSGLRSQGNFDISSNGTAGNPLANIAGIAIGAGTNGYATATFTTNSNRIAPNNTFASGGISGGAGIIAAAAETPDMTWIIQNNNISATDGNGILAVARGNNGILKAKIQNNTVAAPLTGVRPGIRVDAGTTAVGSDCDVCLNISGNTSAGSGGTQGIGLRKQGTSSTVHAFGINGMAATSTPGVEAYVDGLNPAGGGTLLISATSGFSNCSFP
jgi:VCBS repeat-containing protein